MAIIVILEEYPEMITVTDMEWCWDNCTSWILLYQIALHYPDKRESFFEKLRIAHNKNFYNRLFEKNFTFYKKS